MNNYLLKYLMQGFQDKLLHLKLPLTRFVPYLVTSAPTWTFEEETYQTKRDVIIGLGWKKIKPVLILGKNAKRKTIRIPKSQIIRKITTKQLIYRRYLNFNAKFKMNSPMRTSKFSWVQLDIEPQIHQQSFPLDQHQVHIRKKSMQWASKIEFKCAISF